MGYKVITAVASPVIDMATVRAQLRLDLLGGSTHPDDGLIQDIYMPAARKLCEHDAQISIGVQTLELALDAFPAGPIELPLGAATITSIKYLDAALVEQTLITTAYTLDDYGISHFARSADVWPAAAAVANAVKVRYVTPALTEGVLKSAMLLAIDDFYANRGNTNTERGVVPTELPLGIKALLATMRNYSR